MVVRSPWGFQRPRRRKEDSSSCLHSSRRFSISLSLPPVADPAAQEERSTDSRDVPHNLLMLCS